MQLWDLFKFWLTRIRAYAEKSDRDRSKQTQNKPNDEGGPKFLNLRLGLLVTLLLTNGYSGTKPILE